MAERYCPNGHAMRVELNGAVAGARNGERVVLFTCEACDHAEHVIVLVGQADPDFADDPAYHYVTDADELPRWDERGRDPMVKVKLFSPSGRFTYYATAYTDDDGHRYLSGYCLSPLGPDCDEFGDMGADEVEGLRVPPFDLPLERDVHFTPRPISEVLAALGRGEHV
jgi:Protein of unknown function (DUF2958)